MNVIPSQPPPLPPMAEVTLLNLLNFLDDENVDTEEQHSPPIDFVTATNLNDDLYWSSEFDFYVSDHSSDNIQTSHLLSRPQNSISHRQSLVFDPFDDDDYVSNPESSSDLLSRENQVNFVIDLLHQRVEQSQWSTVVLDPGHGSILDLNFGVIEGNEEMGSAQLNVDLGLGFFEESSSLNDERSDFVGENVEDVNSLVTGLRVMEIGSDTDSDLNLDGIGFNGDDIRLRSLDIMSDSDSDLNIDGINFNADESEDDIDDQSLGFCWDSFQIEDHQMFVVNHEFDWEEVDEGEVLTISLMAQEERTNAVGNLEWEIPQFDPNPDTEHEGLNEFSYGDHDLDEYNYPTDYDMFFGHIGEGEIAILGRPPAAKEVIKNLPVIVLSKEDVEKDNVTCAVCRDEMEAGETATQLSCFHKFHGVCISPWLGIRNTCPVCRFELPTDDQEYEKKRRDLGSNQIQ